jgi:chromosome segregation ATPase
MRRNYAPSSQRRLALALSLCLGLISAHAADDKDKKAARAQQDRIAKMQQAQQALQQEKTQLSTERDELQGKLQKAQAQASKLAVAVKREAELRTQLQALEAEKTALADSLKETEMQREALRNQLESAQNLIGSTQNTLANTRNTLDTTQQSLAQRSKSLAFCEDQNRAYYSINLQLLQRFESTVATMTPWYLEPWKFDRVALENEALVIRDQIEERKLIPDPKAP